jgi:hypothetical protein
MLYNVEASLDKVFKLNMINLEPKDWILWLISNLAVFA